MSQAAPISASTFEISTLDDEIRVDHLCDDLLQGFCAHLRDNGMDPLEAATLARGADYFLREFVIPDRRMNIYAVTANEVRQFAANWYIVRNLEPNMEELEATLRGVDAFYRDCADNGQIPQGVDTAISAACSDLDFYAQRIESFWAIEDGGFESWNQFCPLKETPDK